MVIPRRRSARSLVRVEVGYELEGRLVAAASRDLSLGGMFVETSRPLPYGAQVALTVRDPSLPWPVVIDATVRWETSDGFGVQFSSLGVRETWAVNQILGPAAPGRPRAVSPSAPPEPAPGAVASSEQHTPPFSEDDARRHGV